MIGIAGAAFMGVIHCGLISLFYGLDTLYATNEIRGYTNDSLYVFLHMFFNENIACVCAFASHLILLVLTAHVIGYPLYGYLLKKYSATFLALTGSIIPLITAIFGYFILHETLPHTFFISCIAMSLSLTLFYYEEKKRAES